VLVLFEIDLTLTADAPKDPEKHVIHDSKTTEAFATHQWDFAPIRMVYDLECVKWDASNHKCLMVIKISIIEAIMGSKPKL
jgi:hypothetical protein